MPKMPGDDVLEDDVLMKRHPHHLKQSLGSSVEGSPTHPIKETDESARSFRQETQA